MTAQLPNPLNRPRPGSPNPAQSRRAKAVASYLVAAVLSLVFILTFQPAALRAADITSAFSAHNPDATTTIDHAPFTHLLKTHVVQPDATGRKDGLNRVNYRALKAAQPALKRYLKQLGAVKVTNLSRREQFAFWANLYNALTLDVVLNAYPVKSIRDIDISPGIFSNGPWGKKLITIEGRPLSLDDIEHKILRPVFKDPRVHYAVNCASIGCPNLGRAAFTGSGLSKQLNAAATAYINSARGVDAEKGGLRISKIYSWFKEDFGTGETAILNHLKKYAKPALKAKLQKATAIDGYFYDWSLNDQPQ